MTYTKIIAKPALRAEVQLPLRKWLIFLLLAIPFATCADARLEQQIRAHISAEVQTFARQLGATGPVKQELELTLPGGLDKQGPCRTLQISRSNSQKAPWGRVSYSLDCKDNNSWQSRATAKVRVWLPVVVANQSIQKNELLTAAMLGTRLTELTQSKLSIELNPAKLVGMQTKRRIQAGQVISRHLLEHKLLVEKGSHVLIRVQAQGFEASTKGVALENGQLGQRIKVQNLSSGTVLEADVVAEATVQSIFK
ncbi:flagellar basal body P-ring formation protein FlgA [Rheinheimera mesophila]|uniref:Flagella basal body P-ring formation protein FlgA n=1 Tax=Rheinheimera mesophila TaxID=1547515 RepID=A0A3P3QGE3_9GAMM|nr:flagellar basal body P-ring formation chaperone FlgA [Rheinheimera mesophila]RRJ20262.1 flagellar basal body P-ring formation protein FlgA [Rheinheimera mesophila]